MASFTPVRTPLEYRVQCSRFPDGGFVLHSIHVPGVSGHYSAWFGPDGEVRDAERFAFFGAEPRSVPSRCRNVRDALRSIARAYVLTPAERAYLSLIAIAGERVRTGGWTMADALAFGSALQNRFRREYGRSLRS